MAATWYNIILVQILITGLMIWGYPTLMQFIKMCWRIFKKYLKTSLERKAHNNSTSIPNPTSIIGNSNKVEVKEADEVKQEPISTLPSGTVIDEPEINPDDIEIGRSKKSSYEIFKEDYPDYDPNLSYGSTDGISSGVTLDQLENAIEVVKGERKDFENMEKAGKTLYDIENTDLYSFVAAQSDSEIIIEALIATYINSNLKNELPPMKFDITQYIQ